MPVTPPEPPIRPDRRTNLYTPPSIWRNGLSRFIRMDLPILCYVMGPIGIPILCIWAYKSKSAAAFYLMGFIAGLYWVPPSEITKK